MVELQVLRCLRGLAFATLPTISAPASLLDDRKFFYGTPHRFCSVWKCWPIHFPSRSPQVVCLMNSTVARNIAESLNPTILYSCRRQPPAPLPHRVGRRSWPAWTRLSASTRPTAKPPSVPPASLLLDLGPGMSSSAGGPAGAPCLGTGAYAESALDHLSFALPGPGPLRHPSLAEGQRTPLFLGEGIRTRHPQPCRTASFLSAAGASPTAGPPRLRAPASGLADHGARSPPATSATICKANSSPTTT